ncbi:MAG: acetate--CoA ligase [Bacteroidota bacterium]|nr:acetate--CoA ligase [Bacteroidota bacterium]MDP4232983.1 acetate--CoA ligase [Bacteroidota bacterium]MDP4242027.1 acetate--CoA ligase [Bacteroidota bacterium]MDP4286930.1 acetate--CoA ligase [Bacteroidota bacterium]
MSKSSTKQRSASDTRSIESTLGEKRLFKPSKTFAEQARIGSIAQYEKLYRASIKDPEKFFAKQAEELTWFKKWRKVLEWRAPNAKWFVGGKLNASYNCIDRHLTTPRKNKAALIWEGEPSVGGGFEQRTLTYQQLHREVSKCANVLKSLGIAKGDRVALYMGMTPELAIAVLACARIGATHSVIFGGFSSEAIRDRVNDMNAKLIVTSDGAYRRGQIVELKQNVDHALRLEAIKIDGKEQTLGGCPSVEKVLVVKRTGSAIDMIAGRDVWWHDMMAEASANCPAVPVDSEHPLYILYTSGTTGKPKGIVHTTAGYLLGTYLTTKYIFDLRDEDVFWCTADVGWVTGHSYIIYGPLSNGATVVMYEGAPTYPAPDRFWDIIERHGVNVFYTAPTAIRAFIRAGDEHPNKHDLSSLRLLGTVGEPINPEAWMWYHKVIGKGKCPIVDTWWQTETGAIMISPLPGAVPTTPGSATLPFFGIEPEVVHKDGSPCKPNEGGYLIIKKPWPSMLRGIYKDPERFQKQYFSEYPGIYFTGDGARRDKNGYFWIMGRVDDVINVAGHRLGTMEVESALVGSEAVAEAAVVGRPDEIKGSALVAFVTLKQGWKPDEALKERLRQHVSEMIGPIAKPDEIRFSDALPKTRSGKIMRRLLRELASTGSVAGDTTTLEDFSVLERLRAGEEE